MIETAVILAVTALAVLVIVMKIRSSFKDGKCSCGSCGGENGKCQGCGLGVQQNRNISG